MKKDNRLIAEFMGYTNNYWYQNNELAYHTSWDALMPVVEKIAEYRLVYPKQTDWVCECKIVIIRKYLYR